MGFIKTELREIPYEIAKCKNTVQDVVQWQAILNTLKNLPSSSISLFHGFIFTHKLHFHTKCHVTFLRTLASYSGHTC